MIRVNGAVVTLNQLSEITYYLADIHTQLDTKKLFDVHNYVNFIDDTTSLEILDEYKFVDGKLWKFSLSQTSK